MITLLTFEPFLPSPGLAIWSALIFLAFWLLMAKYAFKPIANALEKREHDIQTALDSSKAAKQEMLNMKAENEALLAEAREERSIILQEAKDLKNKMINDAKDQAKAEASKISTNAQLEIENQKKAAMAEVKNKVGGMAIEIAEKLVKKELGKDQENQTFVKSLVDGINLN